MSKLRRWLRSFGTLGWYLNRQEAKAKWKQLVETK